MNKYIDLLRLKIKGYIIIDDFFPDEICTELREKIYNAEKYNCKYWDYKDLIFDVEGEESIKYISDKYVSPKISLAKKYIRSWAFVYNTIAHGVHPHADPSFINVNIWITPDECIYDHNKNGLIIYRRRAPTDWDWRDYNRNFKLINNFLEGSKYDRIPYKYNRAVIFRGNAFHETDSVHTKPGDENRRANYTFLYA